ncbi:hypothetical protein N8I74_07880 [Chitiniphilus purpureus]|uniref:Uncharacterized protein n=1 Tax=Chitiniphilus purpureus TaxID=2981137 RepID=A0ABY6DSC9_9NEIS|nr:hypothetical protein [Chitiniphilus sp. CD1]UXY16922.1 hypothetical protein N8I74_07880 [Chitiniphilus sp. CD1]
MSADFPNKRKKLNEQAPPTQPQHTKQVKVGNNLTFQVPIKSTQGSTSTPKRPKHSGRYRLQFTPVSSSNQQQTPVVAPSSTTPMLFHPGVPSTTSGTSYASPGFTPLLQPVQPIPSTSTFSGGPIPPMPTLQGTGPGTPGFQPLQPTSTASNSNAMPQTGFVPIADSPRTGKGVRKLPHPDRFGADKIQSAIGKVAQPDENQKRLAHAMQDSFVQYESLMAQAKTSSDPDKAKELTLFAKGMKNESMQYYSYYKKYGKMNDQEKQARTYHPQVGLWHPDIASGGFESGRKPDLLKTVNKGNQRISTFLEFKSRTLPESSVTQITDTLSMLQSNQTKFLTRRPWQKVDSLSLKSYKVSFAESGLDGNTLRQQHQEIRSNSTGQNTLNLRFKGTVQKK